MKGLQGWAAALGLWVQRILGPFLPTFLWLGLFLMVLLSWVVIPFQEYWDNRGGPRRVNPAQLGTGSDFVEVEGRWVQASSPTLEGLDGMGQLTVKLPAGMAPVAGQAVKVQGMLRFSAESDQRVLVAGELPPRGWLAWSGLVAGLALAGLLVGTAWKGFLIFESEVEARPEGLPELPLALGFWGQAQKAGRWRRGYQETGEWVERSLIRTQAGWELDLTEFDPQRVEGGRVWLGWKRLPALRLHVPQGRKKKTAPVVLTFVEPEQRNRCLKLLLG